MFDYIIFGIVDNGVMILGAFTGLEVERYLPRRFRLGAIMPIVGAGIGNTVSDFMGGVAAGNATLAIGTGLGCLIGLLFIPAFMQFIKPTDEPSNG